MDTDWLKAHQSVECRLPHASKTRNMRQFQSLLSSSTLVHELQRLILWEREEYVPRNKSGEAPVPLTPGGARWVYYHGGAWAGRELWI